MRKRANIFLSSSSSQSTEDLVEESEETMVLTTEYSRPSSKKSNLLKPCFTTSIDGSSSDVKALSKSVSFHGYRFAQRKLRSWARKMSDLHKPTWKKAGILEAVMASTKRIYQNRDLVLGIAEKWCPDTKTFVFPWGETTITLEDVMVLLGFSVLGSPVFATLDSSGEKIKAKLEREWAKIKRGRPMFISQVMWMKRFMNSGDDDELEHVAFLVLWLSYFVFPSPYYRIPRAIFPIAIHLSRGTRLALAPAVLAHLYDELTLLKRHIRDFKDARTTDRIDLTSLFKLVQVWTWERFRELQPKPNRLLKGEPRLARWSDLKQERSRNVRQILDNSSSFEWRPYTSTVQNWEFPKFYPEKAMSVSVGPNLDDEYLSFARCIKVCELVGIDRVEHYFPNRVALQFGMRQDVPAPVNRSRLSQKEAWKEYDKPIDDFALYIPSRSETPRVTPMFCEWRRNSFQEFKSSLEENLVAESASTLRSRNVIGGGDTSFVPSGSKMKRTSDDRMKRAGDKRRKKMKQEPENIMGKTHVPSDNDEEDDSLTVAQIMRQNHKDGDVKNSGRDASDPLLGANGGVVEDIAVSRPKTWERNPSDELNVHGSNTDVVNDGRKEPKCLLQEDQRSDEKLCGETDKENGVHGNDSLIQKKLAVDEQTSKEDNSESSPRQKLAGGGANGEGTSKAFMVLSPSDESNIHIAVGDGTKGKDCLLHDDGIGSEENMKSNAAGDDSNEKSQELKVLALSIEERILKAERKVARLKERRAIKQRKIAAARLI